MRENISHWEESIPLGMGIEKSRIPECSVVLGECVSISPPGDIGRIAIFYPINGVQN